MSAALQPPVGPPATRASTASHAALPGVQISFDAMLAQAFEPASPARAFAETGVLGDRTPAIMRETAIARPPRASIAPQDAVAPTVATQQRTSGVAQSAPTSPSAASSMPQRQAPARTADLRRFDAPRARVFVSPGALRAEVQFEVNQLHARASGAPRPTPKRTIPSAFFVALSETASGVRVQARVAAMSPTERGHLRQHIHALLAQHGMHSATIEVE